MTIEERDAMVLENLSLVDWVVKRKLGVSPGNQYYDDLVQEGRIELMKAAELFEEERGVKFSTYAVIHVYLSLKTRRYAVTYVVPPTRQQIDVMSKVLPLIEQGYTDREIIEMTGIDEILYADTITNGGTLSLDCEMYSGENSTDFSSLGEFVVDERTVDMYDNIIEKEHIDHVIEIVLERFKGWERDFLAEYFQDIRDGHNVSLREYGEKYGYTKQWLSPLVKRAKNIFIRWYKK